MKTQAISKKAAAVLQRAKKAILKNPHKYDQGNFCGTEFCIAGHIVANEKPSQWKVFLEANKKEKVLIFKNKKFVIAPNGNTSFSIFNEAEATNLLAKKILGEDLDPDQLFNPAGDWPLPFRKDFINAATDKERAKIAARRIEHFIKTGE